MADNPYMTLADQDTVKPNTPAAPQGDNAYMDLAKQDLEQTQQKIRGILDVVSPINPDQAAEATKLSRSSGLPEQTVQDNLAEVKRMERVRTMNLQRLITDSPVLARQLTDPNFAKLSHDNVENLSEIERTITGTLGDIGVTALKGAVGLPQSFVGLADIVTGGYAGKGVEATGVRFNEAQKILSGMYSPAQQAANARVQKADGFLDTLSAAIANPSVIGTTVGESLPQMIGGAGVARGILSAAPKVGGLIAGAAGEGIMGAGSAAESFRGQNSNGLLTLEQEIAAVGTGVGTSLFSLVGGKLAQKLGIADIDTALATGAITQQQVKQGLVRQLAEAGVSEGLFEELPQSAQEQVWQNFANDRPLMEGVGNAAAMGLVAGAVTGGAFQGVQYAASRNAESVGQANTIFDMLNRVNDLAGADLVRQRDVETFANFMQAVENEQAGPVSTLYIAPKTLLETLAASGADIQQVMASVPSLANLPELAQNGTDVAISVTDFATHIAGSDYAQAIMPHLKADPTGMTKVEADEYLKNHGEQLKAEVEKVIAQVENKDAFKASMDKVKAEVKAQLDETKRFTSDVNDAYATLMATFYATTGAKLGMSPEEMSAKYPVKIAAQGVGGMEYDQAGQLKTETPKFKAWFGKSKVVDEQGKPMVLYHGAKTGDITQFNTSGGKGKTHGTGLFMSADPSVANTYTPRREGGTIYPVYVSMQNPLIVDFAGKNWNQGDSDAVIELPDGTQDSVLDYFGVGQDETFSTDDVARLARERGHDGVIIRSVIDNGAYDVPAHDGVTDLYVAFEPTQIKSVNNDGEFDANNPDILHQKDSDGFKKWTHGHEVIEIGESHEYKAGEGVVVEAVHGTTGDFDTFEQSKANIESDLGGGFYFTNNVDDVGENYAGFGPDLTNKIERRAEQLFDELGEDERERIVEEATGKKWEDLSYEEKRMPLKAMAREELSSENDGFTMPVYVRFDNPVVIGGSQETFLDYTEQYDEETDEYGEPEGKLVEFVDALRDVSSEYSDADADGAMSAVWEYVNDNGGISAGELIKALSESEGLAYSTDDNGALANKEIIRRAFEQVGFDGFIDQTVNKKFGSEKDIGKPMEGMDEETVHFIAFNPTQIKSRLGNNGEFSEDNPNILKQGEDTARGSFNPETSTITLLKAANLSTFLHESGHFFLEVNADIASRPDAPVEIAQDMQKILDWFGVENIQTWRDMDIEAKRPYHEQFARGFEAYLFEGKSPSTELQGVFQRFRSWLVNIYKQLSGLNVQLDEEIRGVFDRMLASSDAIQQAEAARSFAPLFTSKPPFMTDEEWLAYQQTDVQSAQDAVQELETKSLRDMQWLTNAKTKLLKAMQRENAELRKEVRREVEAEVMAEPVYRAREFFKRGTLDGEAVETPVKLAIPEIEAMYEGNPIIGMIKSELGFGKYGMLGTENGMHPEQAAELFGFTSGDHLIRSLLEAPDPRGVIEQRTDQTMMERYGDINSPQAMSRAADEAIHNDARARFVATEANALAKAVGKPRVVANAAKQYAEQIINRLKIRNIKAGQYAASAARAGREAAKSKDLVEQATAKRNQLINTYAAKAAYAAQDEVIRGVRYLQKFNSKNIYKTVHVDYLEQIQALLDRFDLRSSTTLKQIDRKRSLDQWVKLQQEKGEEPVVPQELLDENYRTSYKEMTLEDFRGLIDTIRNIEHLGRLKDRLIKIQDQREFKAVSGEASETIRENATGKIQDQLEQKGLKNAIVTNGREILAWHRKFASLIRQMDGFKDGGTLWSIFVKPMNEAGTQEASMREQATVKLAELYKLIRDVNLNKKEFIPEIGNSLSYEARLAVALNMGNETNMRRVLEGENWTPEQVQAILKPLTRDHWNFVQGVWDNLNSYWPEIAAKERRLTGIVPEKVESRSFVATLADGTQVTLAGGYYPIKYNAARSSKAAADTAADVLKQMERGLYARAQTARGHIESRMESVGRPMRYDLGVIDQHLNQVIHDLSWHEYLIDANRLLRADSVDAAIREHYGPEVLKVMQKTMEDIAIGEIPSQGSIERGVRYVRSGVSVASMGWNLITSIQQPLGLTQSAVRIGPKWVAKGIGRWLRDASSMESTVQWVGEKSEFMRLRAKTMQREISEIRNTIGKGETMSAVEGSFFYLIGKMQLVADIPTWIGMYEKSMAEGNNEDRAIALADQAVLDSQGGGQIKDLSMVQRGGEWQKLWTNFYSFFNVTYNNLAESVAETQKVGASRLPLLAVDFLMLTVVPATLGYLLKAAVKGTLGDDDEDKLIKKLAAENMSFLMGMMIGTREVGSALMGSMGYEGPAGARFFADVAKFGKQVAQGDADEAFWRSANELGGVLLHYPAVQVDRTVRGIIEMSESNDPNPLAPLFGPKPKN